MNDRFYFDVSKLVRDMGGAAEVARITGKQRTAPYRWITQGFLSSRIIEQLKTAKPDLKIDSYIKR